VSLEDLQERGVVLPEEEWGTRELRTEVERWPLVAGIALAVAGLVLAYLGGGSWVTLAGVGAYLLAFFWTLLSCTRGLL
jgi:CO dehydrogenase/acetyl-CoA synthase delta subunit